MNITERKHNLYRSAELIAELENVFGLPESEQDERVETICGQLERGLNLQPATNKIKTRFRL